MIELDPTRFRLPPYEHQLRGTKTLLKKPFYGLFWKMRLGKSKAVTDAACTLMDAGEVDTCVICCPAQVKDVWLDPTFGEIKTHAWGSHERFNYHARSEEMLEDLFFNYESPFIVSSFEFLRQEDAQGDFPKVRALLAALKRGKRRTCLVLDEGSALGTWNSLQTKAMMVLRYSDTVKRCVVLDGTPAGNSTLCLYSKFALIDKEILGVRNFWQFRGRYATVVKKRGSGRTYDVVVGFRNLDDLTKRTIGHCEYLGQETLDMPTKVPSLSSVTLSKETWKVYKQMKDEMLAELDSGTLVVNHAAVKALRLAQICSGFLGGWDNPDDPQERLTKEVGDEVTKAYLLWLENRLAEDPEHKTVVWCRWRPEIERLYERLVAFSQANVKTLLAKLMVARIYGGTKQNVELFHPSSAWEGPMVLIGQPKAAQYGLNLSRASTVTYLSQDYDLVTREQSEDRVQAPRVRATTLMTDVLVHGPNGEKTITHDVVAAQRLKVDLARRTVEQWKEVLSD